MRGKVFGVPVRYYPIPGLQYVELSLVGRFTQSSLKVLEYAADGYIDFNDKDRNDLN